MEISYLQKLKTAKAFKEYCKKGKIKMPSELISRRHLFIEWYLKKNITISIAINISNLSQYFLYISERTIEETLFYNEPSRKPY